MNTEAGKTLTQILEERKNSEVLFELETLCKCFVATKTDGNANGLTLCQTIGCVGKALGFPDC